MGRKIDADEVFSKMATAGSTLPKEDIEAYLVDISAFKVGDVVGLELVDKTFRLVKLPAPARRPSKLPK
ncbi:MAG TPA: hypothetical protein VFZ49_06320 [Pyrinomonadaceae bacterium]